MICFHFVDDPCLHNLCFCLLGPLFEHKVCAEESECQFLNKCREHRYFAIYMLIRHCAQHTHTLWMNGLVWSGHGQRWDRGPDKKGSQGEGDKWIAGFCLFGPAIRKSVHSFLPLLLLLLHRLLPQNQSEQRQNFGENERMNAKVW